MERFRFLKNGEAKGNSHLIRKAILLSLIVSMLFYTVLPVPFTKAGTNQVDVRIDYLDELAIVTAGSNGSTKFYMSTNQKTWELMDTTGVADISVYLSTKPVNLYFKGNKDTSVNIVTLQGEDKSLKVAYKATDGVGSIEISNTTLPVEYRNGTKGTWRTAANNMPTARYEIKGGTLHFRTTATLDRRAGKIVTVRIPKRPSAPSVKLDGGKLLITGLKNEKTQYRVGDATVWQTFRPANGKGTTLDLKTLLNVAQDAATPAGVIEFRTVNATNKVFSAVKVLEIPAQPIVTEQITLTGTTLSVVDTNVKNIYEYTIVPKNTAFDLTKAKWTTVSATKTDKNIRTVIITKNIAVQDKIYVRQKSYTDSATKVVVPASTMKIFTVESITAVPKTTRK